eukprot:10156082-Karenia_brevis.AAC.1
MNAILGHTRSPHRLGGGLLHHYLPSILAHHLPPYYRQTRRLPGGEPVTSSVAHVHAESITKSPRVAALPRAAGGTPGEDISPRLGGLGAS